MRNCKLPAFLALSTLIFAGPVHADVLGEDITPYISWRISDTSNLFREPDNETSARFQETSLGVRGDVEIGRQELTFDVRQADVKFADETQLDYRPLDAGAEFKWRVGNSIHGKLLGSYEEVLSDFSQDLLGNRTRDVETRSRQEIEANYEPSSRIRMQGVLSRYTLRHSERVRKDTNEDQDEIELSLLFRTGAGTFIGVSGSLIEGDYPNRDFDPPSLIDDGYRQDRYGLAVDWEPSADTSLKIRGGRAERNFDNVSSRDYDAPFWSMDLSWSISTRLNLTGLLVRDIVSIDNAVSSVALRDSLSLIFDWNVSEKIAIRLDAYVAQDDFQSVGDERVPKDEYVAGGIRLTYEVREPLSIGVGAALGNRSSSFDSRDYDNAFYTAYVELRL